MKGDTYNLARQLRVLADPTRLRILSVAASPEGQNLYIAEIAAELRWKFNRAAIEHHIKVLAAAGFVTRRKIDGRVYLTVNLEPFEAVAEALR